jgi:adenosylcobyric acid synthase
MAPQLLPEVMASYRRLAAEADLMLIEGAGSPAEVNLRAGDIANMGFAEMADVPVVLIGDIDRGGVIAQIAGTHLLLPEAERARIKGYVVNKFRGDAELFQEGMAEITRRTGWPALGLVRHFAGASRLPAEDSLALHDSTARDGTPIRIAVPLLPHIANFDDLDPLRAEPDVDVTLIPLHQTLPGNTDLVILPGSKTTLADLRSLKHAGWDVDIQAHRRRSGTVLGLCGGYQILGRAVHDPQGLEGRAGSETGLCLLDIETTLVADKTLRLVAGREIASGCAVAGYEIHLGRTEGADAARPMLELDDRMDGAISADGRVMGCYLHGLFAADPFRHDFLARLRPGRIGNRAFERDSDTVLDDFAAQIESEVDLPRLLHIAGSREPGPILCTGKSGAL